MFCQVEPEQVVAVHDVSSTYHVPLLLDRQGLIPLLQSLLRLDLDRISPTLRSKGQKTWREWKALTVTQDRLFESVSIALVGKYTNLRDSYLSVIKSLEHAAMRCNKKLNLVWVDASHLETPMSQDRPADFHKAWHELCTADGILVPGGFGVRGTEGMMAAARWARQNKIPFLGVCFGMQLAVIEFARNVCGIDKASSVELEGNSCPEPVVIFMPEIDKNNLGGTMRLGLRPTLFQEGTEWSKMRRLYSGSGSGSGSGVRSSGTGHGGSTGDRRGQSTKGHQQQHRILERHRHRYEVNPAYIDRLTQHGLAFVGKDDKGERMEILELKDHPWYVGVQFHPEYLSRVLDPSKPYLGLVAASAGCLDEVLSLHDDGLGDDIHVAAVADATTTAARERIAGDRNVSEGINGVSEKFSSLTMVNGTPSTPNS